MLSGCQTREWTGHTQFKFSAEVPNGMCNSHMFWNSGKHIGHQLMMITVTVVEQVNILFLSPTDGDRWNIAAWQSGRLIDDARRWLEMTKQYATNTCKQTHTCTHNRYFVTDIVTTKARFPLSAFTGRVDGPWTWVHFWHPSWRPELMGLKKMHPSWRAVNSGVKNAPEFTGCELG